jgi:predicted aconitase with swiveling domain
MTMTISTTVLTRGSASAPVMALEETLSFWGGYDPKTGTILDVHHPQSGQCLAGHIVVMPGARGSAGTPACIAEAIRRGVSPAGFILRTPDINIATGTLVAQSLYGANCPVVATNSEGYDILIAATHLTIAEDGTTELEEN